jgi:hypothetical protein
MNWGCPPERIAVKVDEFGDSTGRLTALEG